jgi:alpha/beta superfamily hydrolase
MGRRTAGLLLPIALMTGVAVACHTDPDPPAGSTSVSIELAGGETLDAVEQGDGPNVAILSHGATGTKEGYFPLMPLLADAGWRAIAYDAEGVGESTGEQGVDREGDLAAVVDYARESGAEHIALIGASLGSVVSMESAAEVDADGVIALSAYADGSLPPELGTQIPVMLAVAEDNEPYATDVRQLGEQLHVTPVVVTGEQHGTGMFVDHPELMDQVVAFLNDEVATGLPSN